MSIFKNATNHSETWALVGFITIFSLLAALFIFVLIDWQNPLIHFSIQSAFTIAVVYTLFTITKAYYVLFVGGLLGLLFIVTDAYSIQVQSLQIMNYAYMLLAMFLFFSIIISMHKVLMAKRINTHLICGALVIYLFSGMLWGKLYYLADAYIPGSFKGINKEDFKGTSIIDGYNRQFDFNYYSFTTLATVGVGDIIPMRKMTKSLTTFEAMFGQLYVAVVIAKLVSVWHQSSFREDQG